MGIGNNSPWCDGLQRGVLRFQRCAGCGAAQTLARFACTSCGGTQLAWQDASGDGTVYAVTVVQRAPSEAFRALVPYTLLLVDLAEGVRVMAHGTPGLAIGDTVNAQFHDLAGQRLVVFTPGRR